MISMVYVTTTDDSFTVRVEHYTQDPIAMCAESFEGFEHAEILGIMGRDLSVHPHSREILVERATDALPADEDYGWFAETTYDPDDPYGSESV